mmetsp:Transcript_26581/g.71263  ORF Transcript_26581/g.71263 Transcript_26581/m.71263 type:complete len:496 (+) Transcript_26581:1895-3382(+)
MASPVMRATIQFKWNAFAARLFFMQFSFFIFSLIVVIIFSFNAVVSKPPDLTCLHDSAVEACWAYTTERVLLPVVLFSCTCLFTIEVMQVGQEGVLTYFSSLWNYIDLASFGLQIVGDICWLSHAAWDDEKLWRTTTRSLLAFSVLLMTIKTMYFARGFSQWGPLVRMFFQIIFDLQAFLMILLVVFFGFAAAFAIMNIEADEMLDDEAGGYNDARGGGNGAELPRSFIVIQTLMHYGFAVVDSGLYGGTELGETFYSDAFNRILGQGGWQNTVLYEALMVIVQIVLLNLLIAIMGQSHDDVQEVAEYEAVMERARIIMEAESSWLPGLYAVIGRYNRSMLSWGLVQVGMITPHDQWRNQTIRTCFPTWLHLLKPGSYDHSAGEGGAAGVFRGDQSGLGSASTTYVGSELSNEGGGKGKIRAGDKEGTTSGFGLGRHNEILGAIAELARSVQNLTDDVSEIKQQRQRQAQTAAAPLSRKERVSVDARSERSPRGK